MSSSPLAARLLVSAFLAAAAASGGGCGSSEESVDVDFVGVYRPTTGGNIDAIMFSENKDYMLMPTGCRSQSCAEIGRFQFDSASKLLALTAAKTGETRYLPVQVMETSRGAAKTGGSLVTTKTQQLLNGGGGQQLNSSGGQQLTNGNGEKLAETGQKLIEAILKALIDMQQMQQDKKDEEKKDEDKKDEDKKDEEKPFDLACQQGVPTPASTPADVAAYWQRCPQGVVTRVK